MANALAGLVVGSLSAWLGVYLIARPYGLDKSTLSWFVAGPVDPARVGTLHRRVRGGCFAILGISLMAVSVRVIISKLV